MSTEFKGRITEDIRDSVPDWNPFMPPVAPDGAPNVLFVVWDDMGFGSWDRYGGRIKMPNMNRVADRGVQLSQFHTTALCSPTRSSLLTGRNASSNGMTVIGEMSAGFPGTSCVIPPENGYISEVLLERGYATMAVGKWHLSPATEMSLGGSKRTWPVQRGFERFYGFLGGLTDQWYPDLWYDNHQVEPQASPEEGYHLSKDLADKALEFIADSRTTAPTKPWMMYFCPGACHAPHHVFKEWADRYSGVFDDGYESYRAETLANQKRLGLVPSDTELPPINPMEGATSATGMPWQLADIVQPWSELSEEQRKLFARQAEVYAGFASYTDHQIGRILDYLEESGQLENTIIVAISDNGASAEGGPNGSVNENIWYNGLQEDLSRNLEQIEELGGPTTHPHYSNGWAMAFNTPFKMYKTNASWEGGTADAAFISWPRGLDSQGVRRDEYFHVSDIVPTVYSLLGIEPPQFVHGIKQSPLEGTDMAPILKDAGTQSPKKTQFYSMFGTRAIWAQGWQANTVHSPAPTGWGHFGEDEWKLYHLDSDRNQMHDLSADQPERLETLKALWDEQARMFNGYPLYDLNAAEVLAVDRPSASGFLTSITIYPGSEVPERVLTLAGQSFSFEAEIDVEDVDAQGVIFSAGGRFGGYSLYIKDHQLRFVYNWLGQKEQRIVASQPLALGAHILHFSFVKEGTDKGIPRGTATLTCDDIAIGTASIQTQPGHFSLSGEGLNLGRDRGQAVTSDYTAPFAISGALVKKVVLSVDSDAEHRTAIENEANHRRD